MQITRSDQQKVNLIVLNLSLEPGLKSVVEYLTTEKIGADSLSFARAVKTLAMNYAVYEGGRYRRTAKGLLFVPEEQERVTIMEGPHDEIGHLNFTITYKIIADRFWWP